MDVFTRAIRGRHLSRCLNQNLTLYALNQTLVQHCPTIHHSNQGIQYAFKNYVQVLRTHKVQISMASIGKPEENRYAERLMMTIIEEGIQLSEYKNLDDASEQIGRFLDDVYMTKRVHSALDYATQPNLKCSGKHNRCPPLSRTSFFVWLFRPTTVPALSTYYTTTF